MADAVREKEVCVSCGADVRDGTYYCYACGKPVVRESRVESEVQGSSETEANGDLANSRSDKSERLATAAAERKRSRVGHRKPKQVVWEQPGAASNRIFVLVSLLIFIFASAVVFLTVFMK